MGSLPPLSSPGPSNGDSPGSTPLTIGIVQFNSIECPDDLPIGAVEQKVAVIELLGGGRVVQSLGVQPKPVSWKGRLWGVNVQPRVEQLRAYSVLGTPQSIIWSGELWSGIVREFIPTYHQVYRADYDITLEITGSNNGQLTNTTVNSIPNTDSQVNALTQSATALIDAQMLANAQATIVQEAWNTYLALLLEVAGAVSQLLPSSQAPITSSLASVLSALAAYGSASNFNAGSGSLLPGYVAWTQITSMVTLILVNIRAGQAPQQTTIRGGSLYEVAAMTYGDVTQAFAIAQVNGIPTARLPNALVQSINLPLAKTA